MIAIYVRASTRDQSTEAQLLALRRYAAAHNLRIRSEFIETASGTSDHRPVLNRMLAAARRNEFDILLVWAIDRLSRKGPFDVLSLLQQLRQCGIRIISATEQLFDGPAGDLVISILASFALMETERRSARIRLGLARAREKGKLPSRDKNAETVLTLSKQGKSAAAIVTETGLSRATVYRALEQEKKPRMNCYRAEFQTPTGPLNPANLQMGTQHYTVEVYRHKWKWFSRIIAPAPFVSQLPLAGTQEPNTAQAHAAKCFSIQLSEWEKTATRKATPAATTTQPERNTEQCNLPLVSSEQ